MSSDSVSKYTGYNIYNSGASPFYVFAVEDTSVSDGTLTPSPKDYLDRQAVDEGQFFSTSGTPAYMTFYFVKRSRGPVKVGTVPDAVVQVNTDMSASKVISMQKGPYYASSYSVADDGTLSVRIEEQYVSFWYKYRTYILIALFIIGLGVAYLIGKRF